MPDDVKRGVLMHLEKSGTFVDLSNFGTKDVRLDDIAHNLSRIPRFNGNTCRPISVAEHSLLVMQLVQDTGANPVVMLQAVLHDATEAYIGDKVTALKACVPELRAFEDTIWDPIARVFDVPIELDPCIKTADWIALFIEATALCKTTDVKQWDRYAEFSRPVSDWIEKYGEMDPTTTPHPEMTEKVFTDVVESLVDASIEWRKALRGE